MPFTSPEPRRHSIRWTRMLWAFAATFALAAAGMLAWWGLRDDVTPKTTAEPQAIDPVDIASVGKVPIEPANNAFELYTQASALFHPISAAAREQHTDTALEAGWQAIGNDLRAWLDQNRRALDLFREGSDREQAIYCQPADQTIGTDLEVLKDLRDLGRLAELEAIRLEDAGDYLVAWSWYRALFRASRHAGQHGALIERLIGAALHAMSVKCIVRWATFVHADTAALRTALNEIRLIYRETAPPSTTLSIEYLIWMKALKDPATAARLLDEAVEEVAEANNKLDLDRSTEPAASIQVSRLVFANWLSQCDRPRESRPSMTGELVKLFQTASGPTGNSVPGATPEDIVRRLERAVVARNLLVNAKSFLDASDRELARQRLLEISLLLQIHLRETGAFPENIERLIGKELETLPVDPFAHGAPLHYRRGSTALDGAVLWSLGPDEIDDNGEIDFLSNENRTGDIILRVGPLRTDAATSDATQTAPVPSSVLSPQPERGPAIEERDDNLVKMNLVWCPPGTFRMGSDVGQGLPDWASLWPICPFRFAVSVFPNSTIANFRCRLFPVHRVANSD